MFKKNLFKYLAHTIVFMCVLSCFCTTTEAKQRKRTLRFGKMAIYKGIVENRQMAGDGVLEIFSSGDYDNPLFTLNGTFQGTEMVDGVVKGRSNIFSFEGKASVEIYDDYIEVNMHNGKLYNQSDSLIGVINRSEHFFNIKNNDNKAQGRFTYIAVPTNVGFNILSRYYESRQKVFPDSSFVDYPLVQYELLLDEGTQELKKENDYLYRIILSDGTILTMEVSFFINKSFSLYSFSINNDSSGEYVNYQARISYNDIKKSSQQRIFGRNMFSDGSSTRYGSKLSPITPYSENILLEQVFNDGKKFIGQIPYKYLFGDSHINDIVFCKPFPLDWTKLVEDVKNLTGKLTFPDNSYYEGTFSPLAKNENYLNDGKLYSKDKVVLDTYTSGESDADRENRMEQSEEFQKANENDYYEVDEYGTIIKFRKTMIDLTALDYDRQRNSEENFKVTYADGTIMFCEGALFDISEFKKLYSAKRFPSYSDFATNSKEFHDLINLWYNTTWIFPDGLKIRVTLNYPKKEYAALFSSSSYELTVPFENDDYVTCYEREIEIRKTFDEYTISAKIEKGNHYGIILYNNGDCYTGSFWLTLGNIDKTKHLKDIRIQHFEKAIGLDYEYPYERCKFEEFVTGRTVNKDGDVVAIYKDGKQLDELDVAIILKSEEKVREQRKKEQERIEKENREREKEYDRLCNKYGKRYVDAIMEGKIIVGTHFDLVERINPIFDYDTNTTSYYKVNNFFGALLWRIGVSKATNKVTYTKFYGN